MTGYFPSEIGRQMSARSTSPSSMMMGASQSTRMPSRTSERSVIDQPSPSTSCCAPLPPASEASGGGVGGGGTFCLFQIAPPPHPPPPPPPGGGGPFCLFQTAPHPYPLPAAARGEGNALRSRLVHCRTSTTASPPPCAP